MIEIEEMNCSQQLAIFKTDSFFIGSGSCTSQLNSSQMENNSNNSCKTITNGESNTTYQSELNYNEHSRTLTDEKNSAGSSSNDPTLQLTAEVNLGFSVIHRKPYCFFVVPFSVTDNLDF